MAASNTMIITQQKIDGIGMTSRRTRLRLVDRLRASGISDERVLTAIAQVPRHLFVDEGIASRAYEDTALPIGHGQTISQPYIVALMTQTLIADELPQTVLEVGTGSGYQAALLAQLVPRVYTVERIKPLWYNAQQLFRTLKYPITASYSNGEWGWKAHAPYDAIIVTAAPETVPDALLAQLKMGGKLVIPVGQQRQSQSLLCIQRQPDSFQRQVVESVSFVPFLTGTVNV